MGLASKGCLKIGGACKRGSQENGGGGKKVVEKKGDSVIPYLVCDRHDFFASIFFSPPPFSCHLFFCHTTSFLHPSFFTATTFLSLLFCYQFFQEKCFWKQRQQQNFFGRWQKRGGRKEVTKKRWCRGDGGKGGGGKGMGG